MTVAFVICCSQIALDERSSITAALTLIITIIIYSSLATYFVQRFLDYLDQERASP